MTETYEVIIDEQITFHAFDVILERWQAQPKQFPYDQPGALIPQELIPDWLRKDTEALFNFYFYICLYMRGGIESAQAFRAMIKLRTNQPELFDPFHAQYLTQDELQPIIKEYIGWDAKNVAKFWIENSKRLMRNWDGKASEIFVGLDSYDEALRRIKNKRTKKEFKEAALFDDRGQGFIGFQPKMVSMLVYFVGWEGLLEKPFIFPTPADFHNFRFGFAIGGIVLKPQPKNIRSTEKISKPWRELTMRYLEKNKGRVSPVELADAIWLFSLEMCGNSPLTDYHERRDTKGLGMFETEGLTHTHVPDFLAPKYRQRVLRTCLSCPLVSQCKIAVPAGPYYQRRGARDVAFGGQLYLLPRFPIEEYLATFTVSYLQKPTPEQLCTQTISLFDD